MNNKIAKQAHYIIVFLESNNRTINFYTKFLNTARKVGTLSITNMWLTLNALLNATCNFFHFSFTIPAPQINVLNYIPQL